MHEKARPDLHPLVPLMKNGRPTEALCAWLRETYDHPEWRENNHCFLVRRDVRIPECGALDAVSVGHRPPTPQGEPDVFSICLWQLEPEGVDLPALDRMGRRLQAFGAWYAEFLEAAQCRGFASRHRVLLRGNLVGASVAPDPLIDLLSHWGRDLAFWTYAADGDRLDVEPYYGTARSLRPARRRLTDLLNHLRWRDLEASPTRELST